MTSDERFMQEALRLAREAGEAGEVPIGCVITRDDEIIGRGKNCRETGKNALGHAELMAISQACNALGGWRLWQCRLAFLRAERGKERAIQSSAPPKENLFVSLG